MSTEDDVQDPAQAPPAPDPVAQAVENMISRFFALAFDLDNPETAAQAEAALAELDAMLTGATR
jgi:hypothetical protein